ncbi:hypothetical protein C8R45DRAFT_838606 [Mycena sanguinolenta]|nr:hypothetical protein C8R45DRAFT_838606 [Mycena sanguinolenta]
MPIRVQELLWHAHPSTTTYNVPGKLSLCVGLPVMIRYNEATELCITKGQEARVVRWHSSIGSRKQKILDSLFVELVDPPKQIRVPGLPANVVVLTANKQKTWCNLPDDSTVQITRSQVPVLPNFAMTDYSSQGKTRHINVVDLNNCRTHFSFYTALSRGTSSEGTIILQGADYSKITRGISGYLRQEFRELEALNEITRLRYEGQLPVHVTGVNRRELLTAFHSWNRVPFEPSDVHPAIVSTRGESPINALPVLTGKWQMIGKEKSDFRNSHLSTSKSKPSPGEKSTSKRAPDESTSMRVSKKPKLTDFAPEGTNWDAVNYSCAYDALFTCLFDVWDGSRAQWGDRMQSFGRFCSALADGFKAVHLKHRSLDNARDAVRALLTTYQPNDFPVGKRLTALDKLVHALFGSVSWGSRVSVCLGCRNNSRIERQVGCVLSVTHNEHLIKTHGSNYSLAHWVGSQWIVRGDSKCTACGGNTVDRTSFRTAPPLLFIHLPINRMIINRTLSVRMGETSTNYMLRGVVYLGSNHFTSRIVRANGECWYHDGQRTGSHLESDGNLVDHSAGYLWRRQYDGEIAQLAVGALYAMTDDDTGGGTSN